MLDYLKEELKLNYLELCKHLQDKYGVPSGNYFLTKSCKSKNNKITRGNDGLFLHHIKENEEIDLSKTDRATACPFEYQESKNLCYCNYLEHLILHMKIVEEYLSAELKRWVDESHLNEQIPNNPIKYLGIGGLNNHIIPEINDFYNGYEYSRDWQIKALNLVDFESFEELKKMSYDTIVNTFTTFDFSEHYITKFAGIINQKVFLDNKGKMTDKNYKQVQAKREEHKKRYAEDEEYRKEYDKMMAERMESIKKILEVRHNKDK